MSRSGQLAARRAPDAPHPVFVRQFEYPQGYAGNAHRHRLAQLVYPLRGVLSVETEHGTWVVTTLTAVAIPPWHEHRVGVHGNASLRSVFVDPDDQPTLLTEAVAVHVTPLLHELMREAGRHYTDIHKDTDGIAATIIDLLARLLPTMPTSSSSIWLPHIEHPMLRPLADALDRDPGDTTSAEEWARRLALSTRHFGRVFRQETGISFSTWRALLQVKHALVRLAQGDSVGRVAVDLGYASSSSFIEMFKRHTGCTPGAALGRGSAVVARS